MDQKPRFQVEAFRRKSSVRDQELTDVSIWDYVDTESNPADLATRGMSPDNLQECSLWQNSPDWLRKDASAWPTNRPVAPEAQVNEELRARAQVCTAGAATSEWEFFQRYSTLRRTIRIASLIKLFIDKCRRRMPDRVAQQNLELHLDVERLRLGFNILIQSSRRQNFPSEYQNLLEKKRIPARSPMLKLRPYLDSDGCIRVGGRLQH